MKIIRCNKCNKTFGEWDIQQDFSIIKHIGYGSKYDGCVFEIDLCCDCADKLIEQLVKECTTSPIIDIE